MELELRMLEENSGRKKDVHQQTFKKKEEVEQQSIAPTSTSTFVATPVAMPCFVNVDGNMSVDENGNTYNNNDTEENSDD